MPRKLSVARVASDPYIFDRIHAGFTNRFPSGVKRGSFRYCALIYLAFYLFWLGVRGKQNAVDKTPISIGYPNHYAWSYTSAFSSIYKMWCNAESNNPTTLQTLSCFKFQFLIISFDSLLVAFLLSFADRHFTDHHGLRGSPHGIQLMSCTEKMLIERQNDREWFIL